MSWNKQQIIKIYIYLLIIYCYIYISKSGILIQDEKNIVQWPGCLFKKYPIYASENTSCSDCVVNGLRLAKFSIPMSQNYKNCTRFCARPTICTEYKYTIDGDWRSECYQCENKKTETIKFRSVRSYKICSDECKKCAYEADLSTAIYCSFKCKGYPTFCYPDQRWFGHRKCYQSSKMYGCNYVKVDTDRVNLTTKCSDCALVADKTDAQQCAPSCDGIPTYHEETTIFQCQLGQYHEVFEHDIPIEILQFLKIETPLSKAKAIHLMQFVPSTNLGRIKIISPIEEIKSATAD